MSDTRISSVNRTIYADLPVPELIIFDWDGTLVQSTGHIVRCFERAIAQQGLTPLPAHEIQGIIGLGLLEACQCLFPDLDLYQADSLAKAYREIYFTRTERLDPYHGAEAVLSHLREAGCWLAVATGKSNRGLNEALEETGLRHYFLGTRTAEQTASKPSPKMLMELLDEFGLVPGQAWMIGDTDFDLHMAHNAGCIPIAISHGAHNYERLLAAKPAIIIDDLPSLLPLYRDANAKRDEFK
ncbi:MAG: HAD family hydrolase [Halothiobacillus sp.]